MVSYIFIVTLSGRHQGPMFPPCSCCFSAIFWGLWIDWNAISGPRWKVIRVISHNLFWGKGLMGIIRPKWIFE